MRKMKGFFVAAVIILLLGQVLFHFSKDKLDYNTESKDYYIEYGLKETSSKNLVTAIYLDYRLFDSFFEASLLLIAVAGIAFMGVKDEDLL